MLIAGGADSRVCSPEGDNLLHLCTRYCQSETLCMELVNSLDIDISAKNASGATPYDICTLLKRMTLAKQIKQTETTKEEQNSAFSLADQIASELLQEEESKDKKAEKKK